MKKVYIINDKGKRMTQEEVMKKTTYALVRLGFQASQIGYRFLREAVWAVYQDAELLTSVTKLLYPTVAKRFKMTDKQVERGIRSAIETAWVKGTPYVLPELFQEYVQNGGHRPTNTEVIEALVEYVKKENTGYENI